MATGTNLRTYFDGTWHDGDVPVMKAGDHGAWLGTTVFDGARFVDGMAPDLDRHLARVNASAARTPRAWRDEGLPNSSARKGARASRTGSARGVVAALSR